jgi:Tfp pilus assembly protein PilN
MIQINLLEEQKQKAKARAKVDPQKPLALFLCLVAVGAVLFYDIRTYTHYKSLQKAKAEIERQRREPAHVAQLAKADELESELDRLNKKKVIIEDLITNRINWSQKLGALRDSLPNDIWIEKVSLQGDPNPRVTYQTMELEAATLNFERGLNRTAETMAGFEGVLEDVESRNELWERGATDGPGTTQIWRFSIQAKRPLPASEVAKK